MTKKKFVEKTNFQKNTKMATLANEQRAHQSSELSSNSVNQKTWRIDHFEHIFNFSGCLFSSAKRSHYINIRFSWNFLREKGENHSNLLEFYNRKGATLTHLLDFTFQNYENSSILLTNGFFWKEALFFLHNDGLAPTGHECTHQKFHFYSIVKILQNKCLLYKYQ